VELTHRFTVPAGVEDTWAALNDIESVAGCFPGAKVTSVEDDTFRGTVKVKLGPIALVYNGTGEFAEKDESEHRLVIRAKGKDKRGNGTAGADVVATMTAAGEASTDVEVVTDLAITGKPAQFGRGVIQDVSDKLLGQFASCLEQKLGAPAMATPAAGSSAAVADQGVDDDDPDAGPASVPSGAAVQPEPADDQDAGAASRPAGAAAPGGTSVETREPGRLSSIGGTPQPGEHRADAPTTAEEDDALDLGSALLPVLLKSYGKQVAAGLGVLAVLLWILRRRR
jgi:carbon monoxide dehydrogenase subunit G